MVITLSGKRVLVTGGAGFVGTHLVRRLSTEDCDQLMVLDNLSAGRLGGIGNLRESGAVKFVKGDICRRSDIDRAFGRGVDIVFHLAASFANQKSVEDPQVDFAVNAGGTLNLLTRSKSAGVEKFIYASSSSVYGDAAATSYVESSLPMPTTPYGANKLAGEYLCGVFRKCYGLGCVSLRLSNVYGPADPSGRYRNVIPNFIVDALGGRPLTITGDGSETRDFTYVADCVEAFLLAARQEAATGEIINVATGIETSIDHVANRIVELTRSDSKVTYSGRRPWDSVARRRISIEKAKRVLGYSPKVRFDDGISRTVDWFAKSHSRTR